MRALTAVRGRGVATVVAALVGVLALASPVHARDLQGGLNLPRWAPTAKSSTRYALPAQDTSPAGLDGLAQSAQPREIGAPTFRCQSVALDAQLVSRFRRGEYLDVHNLCVTLDLVCTDVGATSDRNILDALSLLELDEGQRARTLLIAVEHQGADPLLRERAAVVLAWSFLRDGDKAAFGASLATLPAGPRLRLELLSRADDDQAFHQLLGTIGQGTPTSEVAIRAAELRAARRTKRPWLAGVLSAVIPGAGQVYAGSWQGAAVAFVLSSTLIGATTELAYRRLYVSAVAAGVAASFFYVGNILNAADLAARRNDMAASDPVRALEGLLVPEAHP